jgi:DNA invertase Pin-like site-specific DNA recombinase
VRALPQGAKQEGANDMQNYNEQNQAYDYRGKRGLILLRVSTEEQEKKYGFPSQLRSIREKIIEPRSIRILDPDKYIKYDTYTGMEFREREVLTEILEMAKRHEFDVLVMDVLDRLGRKGLQREIYRAELRMHGVRILTTKPEEHADDDSLMGEMIRLLHGFKAEEERNDIVRRTQNGKRERVQKDHKLLGNHPAKYGFKFKDEDKGAYVLNEDPIKIELDNGRVLLDENGKPWTEAKVRRHMFYLADHGETIRGITAYLTAQRIPTKTGAKWDAQLVKSFLEKQEYYLKNDQPILAYGYLIVLDAEHKPYTYQSVTCLIREMDGKGIKAKKIAAALTEKQVPTGLEADWHWSTVYGLLADEAVIGKIAVFVTRVVGHESGKSITEKVSKEDWVYLPEGVVPPLLVTEDGKPDVELFERVQRRLGKNKALAPRNNREPERYLLRGGLVRCGYCGSHMLASILRTDDKNGRTYGYKCSSGMLKPSRCAGGLGARIEARHLDPEVWNRVVKLIRTPSIVDNAVEAKRTEDPNAERRQHITAELAKIKASQKRLRDRLEDEDLDDDTYNDIKLRLKTLADQKRGYEDELNKEISIHERWKSEQEKLKNFHKRCQEMREKLDDPNYEPDYDFKREAVEFFGITAVVWKPSHKPKLEIWCSPPGIVSENICTINMQVDGETYQATHFRAEIMPGALLVRV